jgi:hypothetical protein
MIQPPSAQAMLVVAHPAHELRVLKWCETAAPRLAVLTTGSRHGDDRARMRRTAEIACTLGSPLSGVFGALLDRDLYGLVERADARPLHTAVSTLRDEMIRGEVAFVVVDAWQGYSIAHDLAHLLGRLAAAEAAEMAGRRIEVTEFTPVSTRLAPRLSEDDPLYQLSLSADEVRRKAALAADYPDIAAELAELIAHDGEAALSLERFHAPAPLAAVLEPPAAKPYYERMGEERVAAGLYSDVLRWSHLEPVARDLCARLGA